MLLCVVVDCVSICVDVDIDVCIDIGVGICIGVGTVLYGNLYFFVSHCIAFLCGIQ